MKWTNFLFVDEELGEEFFVAVENKPGKEREAWKIATKYFPSPQPYGEYTDEEADWLGLDTY